MSNVVIGSAARTAIGSYGKSLKDVPATQLGTLAATAALERAGLQPEQVDHVVWGNVIHTAPEDMYMARVVAIKAGIPKEVPAFTVNRLCGTGVQVAPIARIDGRPIGEGVPGPITARMQQIFFDPVRGRNPKYGHFLTPVRSRAASPAD